MLDRGTFMTRATAQYFLNAFYEFAAEKIADDIVRINMGAVSLYPMIGGSFDSEDDEFRAPRNTLDIGATLSQDIRDAVSGISPASLGSGPEHGAVQISSVMDLTSETYRLIDGQKEFRIAGIDLTVPDGEDESLALVAADGVTKVADIAVVSTEDGQRIVCTLATAVPAGTYHVRLVSHGLDPTAPLTTVLHKVTVKQGATPPGPTPVEPPLIESVESQNEPEDTVNLGGAYLFVYGDNLDTATEVKVYNSHDEVVATVPVTFVPAGEMIPARLESTSQVAVEYTPEGGSENGKVEVTTAGGTNAKTVTLVSH